ncbi:hypothetical protein VTJ04DRAFT_5252 [Mycothermus thermophilus]|uniref:uncharacterized protein n=1 Tax=Humicola insolens TaxID=85995 RepID=UPI0037430882
MTSLPANGAKAPTIGFCTLPAEVREIIYHYALLDHSQSVPDKMRHIIYWDSTAIIPRKNWLALLCTCRQIYTEAAPLVYLNTQFLFLGGVLIYRYDKLRWFCENLRTDNARCIRTVHMAFPDYYWVRIPRWNYSQPANLELQQDTLCCLELLRNYCPGITTLILWQRSLWYDPYYVSFEPDTVKKVMLEVDKALKTFPSRTKIEVRWLGDPHPQITKEMRELGWTLSNWPHYYLSGTRPSRYTEDGGIE